MQNQNAILEVFAEAAQFENDLPEVLANHPKSVWRDVYEKGAELIVENSNRLAVSVAEQIYAESETIRTAN
jgi:hypothetical protein